MDLQGSLGPLFQQLLSFPFLALLVPTHQLDFHRSIRFVSPTCGSKDWTLLVDGEFVISQCSSPVHHSLALLALGFCSFGVQQALSMGELLHRIEHKDSGQHQP